MNKKLTIVLSSLIIVLLLLCVIGFSYSYYRVKIIGNPTGIEGLMSNMSVEYNDTSTITAPNIEPGWTYTKTLSVKNSNATSVSYDLNFTNFINTFGTGYLVYSVTSTNSGCTVSQTSVPYIYNTKTSVPICTGVSINAGVTQTYTVTFTYLDNDANDYTLDIGKKFTGMIEIGLGSQTLYSKILADNNEISDENVDFTKNSEQGNTNGLYYTADATNYGEDGERIYYYRGDVDNNWVSFGGYYWRIVRTTAEGGVKLVYSGGNTTTGPSSLSTSSGLIGASAFNTSSNSIYYSGYTYNLNGYDGTQTNSSIKNTVDNWYQSTSTLSDDDKSYLSDTAIYCAKRDNTQTSGNYITYPSNDLSISNRISFDCDKTNKSKYTKTANSSNGNNGYLTYPVAMLTADEISYAGLINGQATRSSYITDNVNNHWWTISPGGLNISGNYAFSMIINSAGYISADKVVYGFSVRPAISLKSCITVAGGDGTVNSPYTLSNNSCEDTSEPVLLSYTGDVQEYTIPKTGTYRIELWGAGFVTDNYKNGGGGYTSGEIQLTINEQLYVYNGQQKGAFNSNTGSVGSSPGGTSYGNGATDIRLVSGTWNNFDSLKSRIMVAGGSGIYNDVTNNSPGGICNYVADGYQAAGGLIGGKGFTNNCNTVGATSYYSTEATGGTQTSGGTRSITNFGSTSVGSNGSFGIGGSGGPCVDSYWTCSKNTSPSGTGGGGGYYGGGGCWGPYPGQTSCTGSGSGSSFISGHNGCDAISNSSTSNNIIHTGQSSHYSNKVFTNTKMIDGKGYIWTTTKGNQDPDGMPNPLGGNYAVGVGHSGNGYTRITFLHN